MTAVARMAVFTTEHQLPHELAVGLIRFLKTLKCRELVLAARVADLDKRVSSPQDMIHKRREIGVIREVRHWRRKDAARTRREREWEKEGSSRAL